MARNRERGRSAAERELAEEDAERLRREARGWFIRVVIALLFAALGSLVSVGLAVLIVFIALGCVVKGVALSVETQQRLETMDG
ncbi:MAG: hypothetical protein H0V81_13190 [Solirubrobacterales bacterium]|nr:hypothetical protein [Solirubrobacterales bacterium]